MGNDDDPEDMLGYLHGPVLYGIGRSLRLLYDSEDRGGLCGNIAHLLLQLSQIPSDAAGPASIRARQG